MRTLADSGDLTQRDLWITSLGRCSRPVCDTAPMRRGVMAGWCRCECSYPPDRVCQRCGDGCGRSTSATNSDVDEAGAQYPSSASATSVHMRLRESRRRRRSAVRVQTAARVGSRPTSEWLRGRLRDVLRRACTCATERSRHRVIRRTSHAISPAPRERSATALGRGTAALHGAVRLALAIAREQHALKLVGADHFSQVHSPRPEGPGSDPRRGRRFQPLFDARRRIAEIRPLRRRPDDAGGGTV